MELLSGIGLTGGEHLIDEAPLNSFLRGKNLVAVDIFGDLLGAAIGVLGQHIDEQVAHPHDLFCLNLDIRTLPTTLTGWLVEQDARVL